MDDSFAIRPDMYAGSPVALERAAAFVEGIDWELAVGTGRPSPNTKFHEFLHLSTSCEAKTEPSFLVARPHLYAPGQSS